MKHESNYNDHGEHLNLYDRIRSNHIIQSILRVLQFLSSVISLGLFSARLYKIVRTIRRAASSSNGAVEGILAAAVAYTLISMILKFVLKKNGAPKWLRWLWIVFDLAFVGGFIAVAVLTRPGGNGTSGPCHYYQGQRIEPNGTNCSLPWGTFILAIVSTLLHAITAIFNEVRDSYKQHKVNKHDQAMEDGKSSY